MRAEATAAKNETSGIRGRLEACLRERDAAATAAKSHAKSMQREIAALQEMNDCLVSNQQELKDQLAAKDRELAEAREQLHDLMVFLDTQRKVEALDDSAKKELQEGTLGVLPAPAKQRRARSGRRK